MCHFMKGSNKNKQEFVLYFSQLALSLLQKNEYRLRFGNKNEQVHFVLLSTCTIFASKKRI